MEFSRFRKQFEPLFTEDTVEEAQDSANQRLFQAASQAGLDKHWTVSKRSKISSSFIFYKNKCAEWLGEWKTPLLFLYSTHPMKKYCSMMGRALTLLVKEAQATLHKFEMLRMEETKQYFAEAQQQLQRMIPSGIPDSAQLWELDVADMFPSLPTRQVYNAVKSICRTIRKLQQKRTQSGGLWFAVHHSVRWLDRMGQGTSKDFTKISETELLSFLRFELFQNTVFIVGSRVYRQVRGVAIGGTASAQNASLYCMWREHQALKRPKRYRKRVCKHVPEHMMPLHPYRYRDNIVGILISVPGYTIDNIKKLYQDLYALTLQVEAVGHVLTTLESVVTLQPGTHSISLHWKHANPPMPHPRQSVIRFIDACSVNCRSVLQGMIPSMVGKCLFYAHDRQASHVNCVHLIHELQACDYPQQWWMPVLRGRLTGKGVPANVIRSIVSQATVK